MHQQSHIFKLSTPPHHLEQDATPFFSQKSQRARTHANLADSANITLQPWSPKGSQSGAGSRGSSVEPPSPSKTTTTNSKKPKTTNTPKKATDIKSHRDSVKKVEPTKTKTQNQPQHQSQPQSFGVADLLKNVKEFIGVSTKVSEHFDSPKTGKYEANMLLKKYKTQKNMLEDFVDKMEKELKAAPNQQRTSSNAGFEFPIIGNVPGAQSTLLQGYSSPSFGVSEGSHHDQNSDQPDQQEENAEKFKEAMKELKGLQEKSSNLMKKIASPDKRNNERDSPDGNDFVGKYKSLLEEHKRNEAELGKLASEVEVMKNEKAIMMSEFRKINYLYETQKLAKEDAREALKEAQKEAQLAQEAFAAKINALRRIIQNAFKGVEMFEPEAHLGPKGNSSVLYRKVKEMEKSLAEALREDHMLNKSKGHEEAGQKRPGLESIEEVQEGSSSNEKKSRAPSMSTGSPRTNEILMRGEKELYETKRKLVKLEKMLEEKDKTYDELQGRYERLQAEWRQKQEENKVHVKVIEQNLESMLMKLEKEFEEEEIRIINYIETNIHNRLEEGFKAANRESDTSLKRVDTALKRCLEITMKAKKKIGEITSSRWEVKNWLEKENHLLRDGLGSALEKVKQLDEESEALKETLEGSLKDIGDALAYFDKKMNEREKARKNGEEEDPEKEKAFLEETLRNVIQGLKNLLKAGSQTQLKSMNSVESNKKVEVLSKDANKEVQDVLESCEKYIQGLEVDREELKVKLEWLAQKRNEEETPNKALEEALREKEEALRTNEEIQNKLLQIKRDWLSEKETMENYVEWLSRAYNEVKAEKEASERQQEEIEMRFQEFWKEMNQVQEKGKRYFVHE